MSVKSFPHDKFKARVQAFRVPIADLPQATNAMNMEHPDGIFRAWVVDVWRLDQCDAIVLVKMRGMRCGCAMDAWLPFIREPEGWV